MYNNRDEAMNFMVKELIKKGVLDKAEQEAYIAKVAAAIPPATRAGYGEDDTVAAANFWTTFHAKEGATGGEGGEGNPLNVQPKDVKVADKKVKVEFTAPVMSDEAKKAAKEILLKQQTQRMLNTPQTSIDALVVKNPKASEMLKGITVVPECTEEKLKEYEGILVDDEKNKEAFNRVKEAVNSAKAMPIHTNDANRKVLGVKISKPGEGEGKKAAKVTDLYTNAGLVGFLATEVMGRIPSEASGIGCQITSITASGKAGQKADATAVQGQPRIKWAGKTAALSDEAQTHIVVVNEFSKTGGKQEVKTGRLRIAESFKVYNGTGLDAKGNRKQKTIRLSGKCPVVPVMKRIDEFVAKFGDEVDARVISANLTAEDKQQAVDLTMQLFAAVKGGALNMSESTLGVQFSDIINKINQAEEKGAVDKTNNFAD